MMKIVSVCLMSCSFVSMVSCSSAPTSSSESSVSASTLKTPDYELKQLDNGIKVYIMQDPSLPMFTIQAMLSKGAVHDFKEREGVAYLMVSMLKEGSGNLSSSQYKDAYSKYSSEFGANVDKDLTYFRSTGLTKYSDEISRLFLDTIFKPQFMQSNKASAAIENYDKIREKRVSQINKSMEDASYLASMSFQSAFFNKQGYGTPELGTIPGIKKTLLGDVQKYYKENVVPENLQFALSGSFSDETKNKILKELSAIKKSESKKTDAQNAVAVNTNQKPKIVIIDKPNLQQAEVRIGHVGPKRSDQNYIPLYISNNIVGSGDFNSKLMQEIRVKKGLVYGVNSSFNGYKDTGFFVLSGSTRYEKVPELIETALDILKNVKKDGVTAEDLQTNKNILLGQFPLKFETAESYLNQQMRYAVYGFDKDYIQNFYKKIQTIDATEASEVLKNYYLPEQPLIVILGSKKQIPNEIKKFNLPVENIDYRRVFN